MTVRHHDAHAVGEPIEFRGYADSVGQGVAAIELSLDGGTTWTRYDTPGTVLEKGVNWRFEFTPHYEGVYVLTARAIDPQGNASSLLANYAFEVTGSERTAFAHSVSSDMVSVFNLGSANNPAKTGLIEVLSSSGVRAVGGGALEDGRIFRSGDLSSINVQEALYITRNIGIETIYDIRNQWEIAARPEPCLAGVNTVALAPGLKRRKDADRRLVAGVIGEYGEPEERMIRNYKSYAAEYPLIGVALRSMAADDSKSLVHCVNGKDRTGVFCAVLMRIAGFSSDDIFEEYLSVNTLDAARIEKEEAVLGRDMTSREHDILMSFLEARPVYLDAFFREIDGRFGSFLSYVRDGLHLEELQVNRLRALFRR